MKTAILMLTLMLLSISQAHADKGMLRITTDPGDAKIYINGKRKGNSPAKAGQSFAIKLAEGEYAVKALISIDENLEKSAEKEIFLADDSMQSVHLKLHKKMSDAARSKVMAGSTTIRYKGVLYQTITSPFTGKVWLDRNLGAKHVCQGYDDELCYGDYYQWGRDADGHEKSNSKSFTTVSSSPYDWISGDKNGKKRQAFWGKTDGSGVCPKGFRVPTIAELKVETLDQGAKNRVDMAADFLALPAAGYRYDSDGSLSSQGDSGCVWSVSPDGSEAQYLYFDSGDAGTSSYNRAYGHSVRCLKD